MTEGGVLQTGHMGDLDLAAGQDFFLAPVTTRGTERSPTRRSLRSRACGNLGLRLGHLSPASRSQPLPSLCWGCCRCTAGAPTPALTPWRRHPRVRTQWWLPELPHPTMPGVAAGFPPPMPPFRICRRPVAAPTSLAGMRARGYSPFAWPYSPACSPQSCSCVSEVASTSPAA